MMKNPISLSVLAYHCGHSEVTRHLSDNTGTSVDGAAVIFSTITKLVYTQKVCTFVYHDLASYRRQFLIFVFFAVHSM